MFKFIFALLVGAGVVAGCSVDDAGTPLAECSGLNCTALPPLGTMQEVDTSAEAPDDGGPTILPAKEACGVGTCLPDDPNACREYSEPPTGGGELPDGGVPVDAGADAGLGADAGADGGTGGGSLDGSFSRPPSSNSAPSQYGCQVAVTEASSVTRSCGAAGTQGVEEACTSSRDCQPGLGCVGTVRSGRCLPFCCAIGPDSCQEGYFCAERPLRDEAFGEAPGPLVPVCDRADDCNLGERDNCVGSQCVCSPETACTLVRPDGTTTCLPPGEGVANQACPCARGYHCSQATTPGMCVKMCDLDEEDSQTCGSGVCQATPVLPEGWGICVGATPYEMPSP